VWLLDRDFDLDPELDTNHTFSDPFFNIAAFIFYGSLKEIAPLPDTGSKYMT